MFVGKHPVTKYACTHTHTQIMCNPFTTEHNVFIHNAKYVTLFLQLCYQARLALGQDFIGKARELTKSIF